MTEERTKFHCAARGCDGCTVCESYDYKSLYETALVTIRELDEEVEALEGRNSAIDAMRNLDHLAIANKLNEAEKEIERLRKLFYHPTTNDGVDGLMLGGSNWNLSEDSVVEDRNGKHIELRYCKPISGVTAKEGK